MYVFLYIDKKRDREIEGSIDRTKSKYSQDKKNKGTQYVRIARYTGLFSFIISYLPHIGDGCNSSFGSNIGSHPKLRGPTGFRIIK